jgi:hypothetical protein
MAERAFQLSERPAEATARRASLFLAQVSPLAEHELVTAIADHLGLDPDVDREELEELKQDVAPEIVLDKLEDLNS